MNRRGLSILETLVAGFVLMLTVVFLFNLLPGSMLAIRKAEHALLADTLCQSVLEARRAGPFNQLRSAFPTETVTSEDGVVFTITSESFEIPGGNPTFLCGLRVLVQWRYQSKDYQTQREVWVAQVAP